MEQWITWLSQPWPWYVAGPIIGLMVPLMLVIGNRPFGISSNLKHLCTITQPPEVQVDFFKYDWKEHYWSMVFVTGTMLGGYVAGTLLPDPLPLQLSEGALRTLQDWHLVAPEKALVPPELFAPGMLGWAVLFVGGILVGFGTRYASGCTSGHAITGLSTLQVSSLYAIIGIFSGGLLSSWLLLPYLLEIL